MSDYRNHKSEESSGMNASRFRDIPSPQRTDGIGVALRRAFAAVPGAGDDLSRLLDELDRKTP
jgi:hypothetical protein